MSSLIENPAFFLHRIKFKLFTETLKNPYASSPHLSCPHLHLPGTFGSVWRHLWLLQTWRRVSSSSQRLARLQRTVPYHKRFTTDVDGAKEWESLAWHHFLREKWHHFFLDHLYLQLFLVLFHFHICDEAFVGGIVLVSFVALVLTSELELSE